MERVVRETVGERGLDGKVMPAMATKPAGRTGATVAIMLFSRESAATAITQLKKSKPGAKLAIVASVKLTDLNTGDRLVAVAPSLNLVETQKESSGAVKTSTPACNSDCQLLRIL